MSAFLFYDLSLLKANRLVAVRHWRKEESPGSIE